MQTSLFLSYELHNVEKREILSKKRTMKITKAIWISDG